MEKNRRELSLTAKRNLRNDDDFPVYNARELAALLGVSTQTLYLWRVKGQGPKFIRETRQTVVYLKSTVAEWMKSHEVQTQRIYHRPSKLKPKRKRPTLVKTDDDKLTP